MKRTRTGRKHEDQRALVGTKKAQALCVKTRKISKILVCDSWGDTPYGELYVNQGKIPSAAL